ncbi:IS630 family transposase [Streptomyces rishiriensis]|uniref:IS630 family transposase n=1 Tax=Streptomyces rishiriensis TaxID=68264 RepID=UPI000D59ECAC|nr:IS630 family transposase [Streptomyces rishiriensis]
MGDSRLQPLVLSEDERLVLQGWAKRRTTAQGLAKRARIVLACADGLNNTAVAARLDTDRGTVSRWRTRFLQRRLDGLSDEPRPGVPRTITDALNTATGKVIGRLSAQHRAVDFRDFLDEIDRQTDPGLAAHVICDSLSAHKAPVVHKWLLAHPRFEPHFTPTYSSWINQVERWFAELQRRCLERGVFCSHDELETALENWIKTWNEQARPFKWTKTADQTIDRICRYCDRISGPGH